MLLIEVILVIMTVFVLVQVSLHLSVCSFRCNCRRNAPRDSMQPKIIQLLGIHLLYKSLSKPSLCNW